MITLYLISLITFFLSCFYINKKAKKNETDFTDTILKLGIVFYIIFLFSFSISVFGTLTLFIIFLP